MPKSPQVSSSDDSSDDDTSSSSDSSASRVPSSRSRKHKSDTDSDSQSEDIRNQYLPDSFKPIPVRSTVSNWARKTLRGRFLGQPIGKDERKALREEYFCSPGDYKEFSAPTIHDSPLALLSWKNSTAMLDLTKVHNEMLFSLRVGLLNYERNLTLCANWARQYTNPVTGKTTPDGPWVNHGYRYKDGIPLPVPYKLRPDVSADSIKELLERDFIQNAATPEEKLDALCKWALSYKEAYDRQKVFMEEMHFDAGNLHEALQQVHKDVDIMKSDNGHSLRLLGSACQQIKTVRESNYTQALDGAFRKFLDSKDKSSTPEEKMKKRANALVDCDIAGEAKKFKKLKKAMESVSSAKRMEKIKAILEAKKKSVKKNKDGSGPSGMSKFKKRDKKKAAADKKPGNGKGKGRGKGKSSKPKKDANKADSE